MGTTRIPRLAAAALAVALLGGCGVLNGTGGSTAPAGNAQVEKSNVVIGILQAPDNAPVKLARLDGYFKAVGLDPVVKVFSSGPQMYPALANGSIDIADTNYVNFFTAVARRTLDAKIVADAYAATPDSFALLVGPNSSIKAPADLAGKKIAIQTAGNVVELAVRSLLRANGVSPDSPQYLPVRFPDMPAALKTGQIDVAAELEPYLTEAERDVGATIPFPLITAATNDLALSGYIASSAFAAKDPKTVAAFQRAIVRANGAITRPGKAATVLPGLTGIDPSLVARLKLGRFPTNLDTVRLQRVVTLMTQFQELPGPLDAAAYTIPLPGG